MRIKRVLEIEREAINYLAELGFTVAPTEKSSPQELVLFSGARTVIDSATRWRDFIQNTLPELKQEGWIIEIADSFKLNFQTAQNWDAEISESQNDWFEMRFNIEVDGQSLPLLPLIMPVLEHYDPENLPEMLSIPLGDHNYLTLPSDKIKPFLAILFELFNSTTLEKDGTLKLSRFNAASLADIEEQSYGLFSLTGGKELQRTGAKIKKLHRHSGCRIACQLAGGTAALPATRT